MIDWKGKKKRIDLVLRVCAEIVDPEGKSSLLSLVKAFDSVLAVYEGFCNLKQVWISQTFPTSNYKFDLGFSFRVEFFQLD